MACNEIEPVLMQSLNLLTILHKQPRLMFWPFLSRHLHIHKNISEKLLYLHDFDYMIEKKNWYLTLLLHFLLHCQYVMLHTTVQIHRTTISTKTVLSNLVM